MLELLTFIMSIVSWVSTTIMGIVDVPFTNLVQNILGNMLDYLV